MKEELIICVFVAFSFGIFWGWYFTKWNAMKAQAHKCDRCAWFIAKMKELSPAADTVIHDVRNCVVK